MGGEMATWEQILLGVAAVLILLFFFPGAKRMLEESREKEKDWRGVLLPLGLVVLFVLLLISLV
ncbi:MAG: hypothetical protein ACOCUJ_02645 [Thiohalospira sp.]|uniref:hypothetical protein n=1 Tax=Thiohalospira sp. TaxID=3080549 RepID=UPI00398011E2